ncbi:MAG: SDR family oxidoreductase [Agriterribacter sp.]
MKILITGSNGFVAGSIIAQCSTDWEVYGVSRSAQNSRSNHISYHAMDMLDEQKLCELITTIQPDVIIHTAAMANIDFCEQHREIAEKINVGITVQLAALCKSIGAKLIFCSTDTVFDGLKGNYTETDQPKAVNFYAATKIKAEEAVLSAADNNVVARLSLVMGLPVMGKGNSFLADIIEKCNKGISIPMPENEIRTPIDVITLGAALIELAQSAINGIIHLAGNTAINRYAMAQQIAEALDFSKVLITGTNSNSIAGRAPRPNNASLDNSKAKQLLATPMRSLTEGLHITTHFKSVLSNYE